MNTSAQRTVDGLKKAMQAEMEGYHFYQMAAQNTADPKGREVFLQLADEEKGHYNFLRAHYDSVSETGAPAPDVKLGDRQELDPTHPIFSEQIRDRIRDAHYEMTALTIGMQLEQSAIDFYQAEAEAAGDPVIKAFYNELMLWEKSHLAAFQAEADALKEDYWNEARFAPF